MICVMRYDAPSGPWRHVRFFGTIHALLPLESSRSGHSRFVPKVVRLTGRAFVRCAWGDFHIAGASPQAIPHILSFRARILTAR